MFKNFKFDSITSPKRKRPAPRNMVISDEAPLLDLPPTPDLNGLFTPIVDELPIQTEVLNLSLNGPLSTMVVNEDCPSNGAVTPLSQCPPTRIGDVDYGLTADDIILVFGDFNVPSLRWLNSVDDTLVPTNLGIFKDFFDVISELCLVQLNSVTNYFGRFLDLIFSNVSDINVSRVDPFVTPEDVYHPTLALSLNVNGSMDKLISQDCLRYDFKRTDFSILHDLLSRVIWPPLTGDLSGCLSSFYDEIHYCFRQAVPISRMSAYTPGPPWFSKELRSLRNRKNRLFKRFKSVNSNLNYTRYINARYLYQVKSKECYERYLERMRFNLNANPRCFYNFVNSKRNVTSFPNTLRYLDKECSDVHGIANLFADFFEKTYVEYSAVDVYYPYRIRTFDTIPNIWFTSDEVLSALCSLKLDFSPGTDGVPSAVLRNCASVLCIPLTNLFNYSLSSGCFPTLRKESYIIPLYKKGNRTEIENYRGIAKLSAIPKLFERLVTDRLVHSLRSIFSVYQHGFMKGKSTSTNLLEFTSYIHDAFSRRNQVDVVYTDFSKAFDKVNHRLLLYKLSALGFPPALLCWISSYLSDRVQCVMFKGRTSRKISVTSGVPQGSHIGPVLFALYLDDLSSAIHHSNILMYADDVKLFSSISTTVDSCRLQGDLDLVVRWCDINGMCLNFGKCKKMTFFRSNALLTEYYIDNVKLEDVQIFNDLGVLFDRRLKFDSHVESIVSRAMSTLGFIKRWSREFNDPYLSKRIYTSLVRPILEYASVVWSPSYQCYVDRVESVQKRFLLFALRGLGWTDPLDLPPYVNRLKLIDLPTLERRRLVFDVIFISRLLKGEINSQQLISKLDINVPSRVTRQYIPLKLPVVRNNYEEHSSFYRLCRHYNEFSNVFDLTDPIHIVKRVFIHVVQHRTPL
ncbi:uncharacterized protein LOC142224978 [Haematobia irritans]|uniref:uncharacterized protein LOC142224978 n=1 Tax=Haematobia irritans TaxID=7368 RepID=UPI003F4F72DC